MHAGVIKWAERAGSGVIYGGMVAIVTSLFAGLVILALQVVSLVRTGTWTNYTLLDFDHYFGWGTPTSISRFENVDYIWQTFLREGSLALTFILYVPVVILVLGFAVWQLALWLRSPRPE